MVGQLRFHEGILSLYLSMVDLDPSPLSLPSRSCGQKSLVPRSVIGASSAQVTYASGGTGPTAAEITCACRPVSKGMRPLPSIRYFSRLGGDGGCGRVLVVGNKVPRPFHTHTHPHHARTTHGLLCLPRPQ